MISIIVPAYNCIKSLRFCVQSILAQLYTDFELILVDDGASDGSGALCDEVTECDTRIRVLHKPNGGVSSARNAGIDAACGEYIVFCDSDDYLEPDYLEQLLDAAKANPDCGHIWSCFQTVTGYGRENASSQCISTEPILHYTLQDYMTLHENWLDTGPVCKLYRTELIKCAKLHFPEDLSLGEDWLFNLAYIDASHNDKIVVVTKPVYNYVRGNDASLDSKYRPDLLAIYRRLNSACLEHLQRWRVSEAQLQKFYNSRFFAYEKVLRNTMRAHDKSSAEKIRWNNAFMHSDEFRDALAARNCFVHPLYLAAYRLGAFRLVLFADRLVTLKKRICQKQKT